MAGLAAPSDANETESRRIVLIVEDDVLIRFAVADYLRDAGFEIVEASNATEAVDIVSSGIRIDAVFSDINMPGAMDGLMLARWVRERHDIPILLASGVVPAAADRAGLSRDDFFVKPYSLDVVEARLRNLLRSPT